MPLIKGFRGRVPCPLWLLDVPNAVIVPLAIRDQTNPLYDAPPGSIPKGVQVVHHCGQELMGCDFRLGLAYGLEFLYAKVCVSNLRGDPTEAYINVWARKSRDRWGTLYCALACTPNCEHECLCGCCRAEWLDKGWTCHLLQF